MCIKQGVGVKEIQCQHPETLRSSKVFQVRSERVVGFVQGTQFKSRGEVWEEHCHNTSLHISLISIWYWDMEG